MTGVVGILEVIPLLYLFFYFSFLQKLYMYGAHAHKSLFVFFETIN